MLGNAGFPLPMSFPASFLSNRNAIMSYHYGAISNVFRQKKPPQQQNTKYHPDTTVAPLKKQV